MSYEVRQPRSGSNPRLISFSRGLRALPLLALMVFFLPCDAQVCDSMDETFRSQYTSDKLVVVSETSWRLAVRSHDRTAVWLCFSACVLSSCTAVSCPVCACTEARWSGGASLVDVPTSCIGLCALKGSHTRSHWYRGRIASKTVSSVCVARGRRVAEFARVW